MNRDNLKIGYLGEKIAQEYLEDRGYFFVEQNYRNKYAEIDLIMKYENKLVFVEVKTRIGEQFGTPEDALNKNKLGRLTRNADIYAIKKGCNNYRIDAICIVLDSQNQIKRINHYENVNLG